jgi:hypothetical protein
MSGSARIPHSLNVFRVYEADMRDRASSIASVREVWPGRHLDQTTDEWWVDTLTRLSPA